MPVSITCGVGCTPWEHMFSACYGGRRIFPDWWIISKKTVNGLMNHNSTCFLLLTSRTQHVGAGTSKMKWQKHTNPCTFLYFTSVVSQSAKPAGFPPLLWLGCFYSELRGELWLSWWQTTVSSTHAKMWVVIWWLTGQRGTYPLPLHLDWPLTMGLETRSPVRPLPPES